MSEPTISIYSILAIGFREDDELLAEMLSQVSPEDLAVIAFTLVKTHVAEFAPEDRAHAARVASQVAAKYAGERS